MMLVNTKASKSAGKPHHRYYESNPNVPKLTWLDLLGRTAVSSDGRHLGKVEAVNSEFVVVKKGIARVIRYWIPCKTLEARSTVANNEKIKFALTQDQLKSYKKDKVPNPANFATLGASTSHMAYPPIPYLPDKMLKEKYKQKRSGSDKEKAPDG